MTIGNVINYIETFAPLNYAEDFDNTGLLVGQKTNEVTGVLVTLDTLEAVVDEAIATNCNLIVSFHPIIFSGLKKLNGNNYVERVVIKAIQNNIAIYAMHTALDNMYNGVNGKICDILELSNKRVLIPQKNTIKKLVTFVPLKHAEAVRNALFTTGAGSIGNYSNCSFNLEGSGSFLALENANPVIGKKRELHFEEEIQIGITYPKHIEQQVLQTLFKAHPYEEVAYEITTLENSNQHIGMGMIGQLENPMPTEDFLDYLKKKMNVSCIRHSETVKETVQNIAVLGGSGAFAISNALHSGADVYVTADVKYHEFYKAESKMIIADIGHYESEQFTKNLLFELLIKKFHNFAIILSTTNTNPIKYL